ncbi:hypothetical protein HPT25_27055 [Bacillus sp. BRMEA1]|uniref:hypothetical protein n=1 Tax=Neobacillus endophyticus TaxID=2738405 RepID=UPI001565C995|nr:hypothetical protein [Neobacillus endophyticus]NRD80985.1 hypothetical protein [Neobacillus endophyticus]
MNDHRIRKSVSFNVTEELEKQLLDFALSQSENFSGYCKDLIMAEMKRVEQRSKRKIIKLNTSGSISISANEFETMFALRNT